MSDDSNDEVEKLLKEAETQSASEESNSSKKDSKFKDNYDVYDNKESEDEMDW